MYQYFFTVEKNPIVWVCTHLLFIHSSVDTHVFSFLLGSNLGVGLVGHVAPLCLKFPKCSTTLHSHQQFEDLSFSTSFPTGVIVHLCGLLLFFLLVLLIQVQNVFFVRDFFVYMSVF